MQYKNVIFYPFTAITTEQLQALAINDAFINQKKLECELRNVNPSNKKQRQANKYIVNNVGIYSKLEVVKAGGKLIKNNKGFKNSFKVTSKFPTGFFNNKYLPTPFVSLQKNFNMPLLVNIGNITPSNITYTIFLLKDKNIDPNKVFEINIMAVGVINPVDELDDSIAPDDTSTGGVPSPTGPAGFVNLPPLGTLPPGPPTGQGNPDRPRGEPRADPPISPFGPPPTATPPKPKPPKQRHTHQHGGKNSRRHHGVKHDKAHTHKHDV